jgi:curli biogenesis system outer membrane secretion channel CsgG
VCREAEAAGRISINRIPAMNKPALLLAALFASATLPQFGVAQTAPAAPATGNLRYTIAVVKFDNKANYTGQFPLSDTWTSILTDSLQRSGRFVVLGEADMRTAAMTEQNFDHSGRTAGGDKAAVIGQMTPAQLLVKGEITNYQDGTQGGGGGFGFGGISLGMNDSTAEINVVVYVVDATTGQVVATQKVIGKSKSSGIALGVSRGYWNGNVSSFKQTNVGKAVENAIDQAVGFIVQQIPNLHWSGNVILVNGDKVYINRGQREGVAVGQIFKVGTSEDLRDPATGELLDTSFTTKGQVRADVVKEKIAICSIVSGGQIEKGMSVSPQ